MTGYFSLLLRMWATRRNAHGCEEQMSDRTGRGRAMAHMVAFFAVAVTALAAAVPAHAASPTVVATVAVGGSPEAIAVQPDGRFAWVANVTSNSVSVIDTASNVEVDRITVGASPTDLAITPAGDHVWVANRVAGTVSVISTATHSVDQTVNLGGSQTSAIAIAPDGLTAWAADNGGSGYIYVINTSNYSVGSFSPSGGHLNDLAFTPNGSAVWVTDGTHQSIMVIDAVTKGLLSTFTLGGSSSPEAVAVSPDGSQAWVSDNGSSLIRTYDAPSRAPLASLSVVASPGGLAFSPDGRQAWVTSGPSVIAAAIDVQSGSVVDTVPTGLTPVAVAVSPDGSHVYVSNRMGNSVTVIATNNGISDQGGSAPTAPLQEFSVPAGTQATQCAELAPAHVDWPGIARLRNAGWGLSYADWPNDHTGGYVCSRQPYYAGNGLWSVR